MPKETPRTEGWGNLDNARDAHYFVDNKSLCGRWLALGGPRWEWYQELGEAPGRGTCKPCWRKRKKIEDELESERGASEKAG